MHRYSSIESKTQEHVPTNETLSRRILQRNEEKRFNLALISERTQQKRQSIELLNTYTDRLSNLSRNTRLESIKTFTVTAYSPGEESTGKQPGHPDYKKTATGTLATEGRTVAADFSILPSGSRVFIEGVGERVVEDTGGAIIGNRLDLYMESVDECNNFGVKELRVKIL
ncbi:MAG: 3D domain-containing protein [Veillonellales bacterium]